MVLSRVRLEDFSAFGRAEFVLAPGINVLIGENGTGKTHALKAIYVGLRAHPRVPGSTLKLGARVAEKLARVFRPEDGRVGRLARRRGKGQTRGEVLIEAETAGSLRYTVSSKTSKVTVNDKLRGAPSAILLPSRELLALYEGFLHLYQERDISFDETYYDACLALSGNPLRGVKRGIQGVIDDLHQVLGGRVDLHGNRFYVKSGTARLEAHLVSEGMRKIAAIVRLLQNGSLRDRGVLLWDEPEANLNPKLVVHVADVLTSLAGLGIQVIIATHDYLLVETLGLKRGRGDVATRFFSLYRDKKGSAVRVEHADHPAGLAINPIRDEFLRHYDRVRGISEMLS